MKSGSRFAVAALLAALFAAPLYLPTTAQAADATTQQAKAGWYRG